MEARDVGGLLLPLADPAIREEALKHMAQLSGSSGFPGGNPISLERKHLAHLRAEPYFVCPKTDGVRAVLLCADLLDGRLLVCLITRALDVYIPKFSAVNRAAFQGTILDVEIVHNAADNVTDLLVFDSVAVCGVPVSTLTLPDRLLAVKSMLAVWTKAPGDVARLKLKNFYTNSADMERVPSPYATDGLIFTPVHRPNTFGRNTNLFKWKAEHTIDFLIHDDGQSLLVYDPDSPPPLRHRVVGTLDKRTFPRAIIECKLVDPASRLWTPKMVRTDKSRANDFFTFTRTLVNIQEKLQPAEIFACLGIESVN